MANMIPISTVTVGSGGASTIEFTNIPQNYTDLQLVISARSLSSTADDVVTGYFNNSGSSLSAKRLYGLGNATYSDSLSAKSGTSTGSRIPFGAISGNTSTSNTFGNVSIYIPNYTSSNYKSSSGDGVGENNATLAVAILSAGLWSNTSPITSITLDTYYNGNYAQYSSATLYGIRKY